MVVLGHYAATGYRRALPIPTGIIYGRRYATVLLQPQTTYWFAPPRTFDLRFNTYSALPWFPRATTVLFAAALCACPTLPVRLFTVLPERYLVGVPCTFVRAPLPLLATPRALLLPRFGYRAVLPTAFDCRYRALPLTTFACIRWFGRAAGAVRFDAATFAFTWFSCLPRTSSAIGHRFNPDAPMTTRLYRFFSMVQDVVLPHGRPTHY